MSGEHNADFIGINEIIFSTEQGETKHNEQNSPFCFTPESNPLSFHFPSFGPAGDITPALERAAVALPVLLCAETGVVDLLPLAPSSVRGFLALLMHLLTDSAFRIIFRKKSHTG